MLGNRHQHRVEIAGSLERLRNDLRIELDQTATMSFIRRVTGRPFELVDRRPFPPDLTGEEIAYRIRLPGATTRPVARPVEAVERTEAPVLTAVAASVAAPVAAVASFDEPVIASGLPPVEPVATRVLAAVPGPVEPVVTRVASAPLQPVRPQTNRRPEARDPFDRARLLRDSAATLAGLAGVAVLVLALWPMSVGRVLDATGTPGPNVAILAPGATESATDEAAPAASSAGVASPGPSIAPGAAPTDEPAATVTPGTVNRPANNPPRTNQPVPRATQPAAVGAPRTPAPPAPDGKARRALADPGPSGHAAGRRSEPDLRAGTHVDTGRGAHSHADAHARADAGTHPGADAHARAHPRTDS